MYTILVRIDKIDRNAMHFLGGMRHKCLVNNHEGTNLQDDVTEMHHPSLVGVCGSTLVRQTGHIPCDDATKGSVSSKKIAVVVVLLDDPFKHVVMVATRIAPFLDLGIMVIFQMVFCCPVGVLLRHARWIL